MKGLITAGILFTTLGSPAFATNLLINGDFSTGDFTGWEYGGDPVLNEFELPWIISQNGNYAAFLRTMDYGTWMAQNFPTEVGKIYRLTFTASLDGVCGDWYGEVFCPRNRVVYPSGNFLEITGYPEGDDYYPISYGPKKFAFRWRATSNQGGIYLDSYGPWGSGWIVDDIVVESVIPEPATWAMMIAGFGLVGSALRRRRGALTA